MTKKKKKVMKIGRTEEMDFIFSFEDGGGKWLAYQKKKNYSVCHFISLVILSEVGREFKLQGI